MQAKICGKRRSTLRQAQGPITQKRAREPGVERRRYGPCFGWESPGSLPEHTAGGFLRDRHKVFGPGSPFAIAAMIGFAQGGHSHALPPIAGR